MEAKRVEVERGWGWVTDGWALFMKSPGMWVLIILIIAVIMLLLAYVPLLGMLVSGLLGTMLAGGVIYGASRLDGGGALEVTHLFQAFQDSSRTMPMLMLGIVSLVASLLMGIISDGLAVRSFMASVMMGGGYGMHMSVNALLGSLLLMLVSALLAALLFYAIPLVMMKNTAPLEAVKLSVIGCLRNWLPLLVLSLIYTVLAFLAALTMGLGFLILGPVMAGAWYRSYKDIYGG